MEEVKKKQAISLSEVKEILGKVDVEEMDQIQRWTYDYVSKFVSKGSRWRTSFMSIACNGKFFTVGVVNGYTGFKEKEWINWEYNGSHTTPDHNFSKVKDWVGRDDLVPLLSHNNEIGQNIKKVNISFDSFKDNGGTVVNICISNIDDKYTCKNQF